jgi:hypothetical protein
VIVSELCELEVLNSLRLRVFRKDATSAEAHRSIRSFERDLAAGVLTLHSLPGSSFNQAKRASIQYTENLGTRGADILHVGAALALGASSFFTFDLQQRKLAEAVGLILNAI